MISKILKRLWQPSAYFWTRLLARGAGAGILLLALAVQTGLAPAFEDFHRRIELMSFDLRMNAQLPLEQAVDPRVVIVDIDEYSLAQEGQWPWPRQRMAELVESLGMAGAAVIVGDIVWAEAERNVAEVVARRLASEAPEQRLLGEQLLQISESFDGDLRLAEALRDWEMVLGYVLQPYPEPNSGALPQPLLIDGERLARTSLPAMASYTGNIALLQEAATYGGFFSAYPDRDGILRRVPVVARYEGALYGSLALEAVRQFYLIDEVELVTAPIGGVDTVEAVRLGPSVIPTDGAGNMVIPYRGRQGSFPYVPAADVLNGSADPDLLAGAIALIGPTARGLFDLRATPVQSVYPGVEVHANLIVAMLDNLYLTVPAWAPGANIVIVLLLGLALALLLPALTPLRQLLLTGTAAAAVVGLNLWLWRGHGLILDLATPLLLVALLAMVNLAAGFLFEARTKLRLKGMFGQYVPPQLVEEMSNSPDSFGFEGETRELTVLFCDIRSFTTISESLSASELKQLLNRFFTPMTRIIFDSRGTIDKYVGDMIMAFWGAPVPDPRHAEQAIGAALEMLAEAERLRPQFAAAGLPEVAIGVGLNSGPMNVGDMGSEYRRAYTVLGDAVNLGSRLEASTKYYGVGLLVGERTRALAGDAFIFRELDLVKVKGKAQAIRVYEPICRAGQTGPELEEELASHADALTHYRAQRWDKAEAGFSDLAQRHPHRYIYRLYLERIAELRGRELPADWDGSYTRTEK